MKLIDHQCPNCKKNLKYNAKEKNWFCNYCNNTFKINDLKNIDYHTKETINEYICPNCNAHLITETNIIATECVYCQNTIIINKTNNDNQIPEKLIPFSIDKSQAIKIFENLNISKLLLPKEFNIKQNITNITGLYVPFWLYSYKYKVNITYNDNSPLVESKKRAIIDFELIPYDANKHLDNKLTNSIEPYNYSELIDFNHSYLSGFIAQKYDIDYEEGKIITEKRANNTIHEIFKNKNSKEYLNDVSIITKELKSFKKYYALLPIWLLTIKHKNNIYHLAINGQTGKISGKLPIDNKKLKLLTLTIFIIIFISLLLVSIFSIRKGLI